MEISATSMIIVRDVVMHWIQLGKDNDRKLSTVQMAVDQLLSNDESITVAVWDIEISTKTWVCLQSTCIVILAAERLFEHAGADRIRISTDTARHLGTYALGGTMTGFWHRRR